MYKITYFEKDPEPHLRRNGKSIEMVSGDNAVFFCEEGEDTTTMGDILINKSDGEFIVYMEDGEVKRTDGGEWVKKSWTGEYIIDWFTWRFCTTHSSSYKYNSKGINYRLTDGGSSFVATLCVETSLTRMKIQLGHSFSVNCDTGVVMCLGIPINDEKTLTIIQVKEDSIKLVHTEIIKTRGILRLDVKKMKISKYDSEECWKIEYQPKTLLDICRTKVAKFKRLYDLVPKEALSD